jgi:hypothetical protein
MAHTGKPSTVSRGCWLSFVGCAASRTGCRFLSGRWKLLDKRVGSIRPSQGIKLLFKRLGGPCSHGRIGVEWPWWERATWLSPIHYLNLIWNRMGKMMTEQRDLPHTQETPGNQGDVGATVSKVALLGPDRCCGA